jgi:hypothetical protein
LVVEGLKHWRVIFYKFGKIENGKNAPIFLEGKFQI